MKGERPRRFLILFSDTGGGHRSSAEAVAEALRERREGRAQVGMVDALTEYGPFPFNRLPAWYPSLVRMKAVPWAIGYTLTDGYHRSHLISRTLWPHVRRATMRLLADHPADAILACHPLLNLPLLWGLRARREQPLLFTLITDLATGHALWYAPGVAGCFAPTERVRQQAVACGLSPERVITTGLPVRRRFVAVREVAPSVVRRRLGLPEERPVVLIIGGAEGMGALLPLCRMLARRVTGAQLVIIAGRNRRLRARLAAEKWPAPVRIEGFVANIHEWMRAADLLVTKAGPSTIAEALTLGLPLVLSGALPGQERPSVTYIVRAGAGVWAPTPKRVAQTVNTLLLSDPSRLRAMAVRAHSLARPDAARRVAETLWEAVSPLPKPPGRRRETSPRPSGGG